MKIAVATLALLAGLAVAAPAVAAPRDDVAKAEAARLKAEVAHDMPRLGALVAADVFYVHASGEGQDRTVYLAGIAKGDSPVRDATLAERSIAVTGDVAITHGRVIYMLRGDDHPRPARFTASYRRERGGWRMVSWQNTAIRAEQ